MQPFKTPILRLTKTTNERGNELTQEKQTQCTLLRHLASNSDRFHGSKHNTDKVHLVNMLNLVKSQWTIIIEKNCLTTSIKNSVCIFDSERNFFFHSMCIYEYIIYMPRDRITTKTSYMMSLPSCSFISASSALVCRGERGM